MHNNHVDSCTDSHVEEGQQWLPFEFMATLILISCYLHVLIGHRYCMPKCAGADAAEVWMKTLQLLLLAEASTLRIHQFGPLSIQPDYTSF